MTTVHYCAECGKEEGETTTGLKTCKSCMDVKYCNAECQRNHWPNHKKICKQRAAELRDEALFKDPPPKEECPICFLPMLNELICCISLPPATISSVPINDFAIANEGLVGKVMEEYYPCCGKSVCKGCMHSFYTSGNLGKCPFCKAVRMGKTDDEKVEELMKRVEANDAGAIFMLGTYYYDNGLRSLQQDQERAKELWAQAVKLGSSKADFALGNEYHGLGDLKKAKFHWEAAAMAGHEGARFNIGLMEFLSGNSERAVKHWIIAASAGDHKAMQNLVVVFNQGSVSRDQINSTLTAYNTFCAEMRSEAREAHIKMCIEN